MTCLTLLARYVRSIFHAILLSNFIILVLGFLVPILALLLFSTLFQVPREDLDLASSLPQLLLKIIVPWFVFKEGLLSNKIRLSDCLSSS